MARPGAGEVAEGRLRWTGVVLPVCWSECGIRCVGRTKRRIHSIKSLKDTRWRASGRRAASPQPCSSISGTPRRTILDAVTALTPSQGDADGTRRDRAPVWPSSARYRREPGSAASAGTSRQRRQPDADSRRPKIRRHATPSAAGQKHPATQADDVAVEMSSAPRTATRLASGCTTGSRHTPDRGRPSLARAGTRRRTSQGIGLVRTFRRPSLHR